MPKARHPHRGSMQFWPRKRARHSLARVHSWRTEGKTKLLGFIGYKAGMTYVLANDNRPKSITKGETVSLPVTIIDCPPMFVVGVSFYKKSISGLRKISSVLAEKLPKELSALIQLPKKKGKKIDEVTDFDDLCLLVCSQPKFTSVGAKKPKLNEIALSGSKEDKLAYAKELLGKEVPIKSVFEQGVLLDAHGITKGKGFQGTVKRYGVQIRSHKAEKTKRGIGNLGAWTPKRVDYRVQQPGKMGFHLRTEYNKQVIKLGDDGKEVSAKGGITKYGDVKNSYLLLKGSIAGPRKRAVMLTQAIRPDKKSVKEGFEVTFIAT